MSGGSNGAGCAQHADGVITGGSHSGPTADCYFARADLEVAVRATAPTSGGITSTNATVEEAPCHCFSEGAVRLTGIFELSGTATGLELAGCGLHHVRIEPAHVQLAPEGSSVAAWQDANRSAEERKPFSPRRARVAGPCQRARSGIQCGCRVHAIATHAAGEPRVGGACPGDRTLRGSPVATPSCADDLAHGVAEGHIRNRVAEARLGIDGRLLADAPRRSGVDGDLHRRRTAHSERDANRWIRGLSAALYECSGGELMRRRSAVKRVSEPLSERG
ncbi:hypothetical protein SAMN06265360_13217 [Haloechinothrix alba]|uniref:Uncharacterized protein n=1 Tax=Haloechinothrix alba TaxID=664784 RepID=A0A239A7I0_9PSEU|nr:hypothetical protein SAMN06265360_13217 [Haloechinothrix alba]